jgi:hypothetical protein
MSSVAQFAFKEGGKFHRISHADIVAVYPENAFRLERTNEYHPILAQAQRDTVPFFLGGFNRSEGRVANHVVVCAIRDSCSSRFGSLRLRMLDLAAGLPGSFARPTDIPAVIDKDEKQIDPLDGC